MISILSHFTLLNPPRSHSFKSRLCNSSRSSQFTFRCCQQPYFSVLPWIEQKSVIYNEISDRNKPPRTSFPGGYKRSEIEVPNIVLQLEPNEVLSGGDDVLNIVDEAVAKWVGIVVLGSGEEKGGQLYDAACLLKSLIRDRAYLLIAERVDIASAVNASGVVLSDQGLPVIVARNMLMASKPESINLPLVARSVQTTTAALNTSNCEDADFLIYGAEIHLSQDKVNSISKNVKLPIFAICALSTQDFSATTTDDFLKSGVNGLVVSLGNMELLTNSVLSKIFQAKSKNVKGRPAELQIIKKSEVLHSNNKFASEMGAAGFFRLENRDKQLIETVKSVLFESINTIQEAAPLMKDVTLLIDAVSQLDDPFLLAIVGEFNSGKSTVINALLGRRYLKEGVVPTTSEITFLRYAEFGSDEKQQCGIYPDAQYVCYLPAPILKEMNIVDTPGTNVILKRQQRLTEEFVPRADLLLFVISADRPLAESEVDFLRYIQQWRKKVVFVLNKSDMYQNNTELGEAISFIKENARNLLNSEHITLFPVSARTALVSKLLSPSDVGQNFDKISGGLDYVASGFDELEMYLYNFLDGSTSAGIERLRLKLETPIGIANKLLCACETRVRRDVYNAKQDLNAVEEIYSTIRDFEMKMQSESITWRRQTLSMIDSTKIRVVKLLESTLQLSNLDLAATLVFKGNKSEILPAASKFQNDIIVPAVTDVQELIMEYLLWLESNSSNKKALYNESFEKRWPSLMDQHKPLEIHELSKNKLCLKLIQSFSSPAASKLFEQEIREAFSVTFGGLGVAGLSASLLTSVLPTTSEDLLALGLCSSGGYLALINFSAGRRKIIEKFEKISESLAFELEDAMLKDMSGTIGDLERYVRVIGKPYENAARCGLDRLCNTRDMLSDVQKKLADLQIQIQNLHVS